MTVRCACCGEYWAATPGETAQAIAADAAWEAEQCFREQSIPVPMSMEIDVPEVDIQLSMLSRLGGIL